MKPQSVYLLAWIKDEASRTAVSDALAQLGRAGEVKSGTANDAAKQLKECAAPDVLIVDITSADAAQKQLDALADCVGPETKVIVTGSVDSLRFYTWLMELGIHDYLLQPITQERVLESLTKGAAKTETQKAQNKSLISIIGARGGVGTTTIASHLAAIAASEHGLATALFDADAHFGSVSLGLDLEPVRGLKDALEKPDRVDALFLERVMVKPFKNLAVLSAEEALHVPIDPAEDAVEALLTALQEPHPLVIADLPRQMTPLTQELLAISDHVVLVVEPSLLNLRDALRLKDYLVEQCKRPAPLLVVNKRGEAAEYELSKADLAKHFGAPPATDLPYLVEAQAALSRGETLLANTKAKPLIDPLRSLLGRLTGTEAAAPPEVKKDSLASLLGRLTKKGT